MKPKALALAVVLALAFALSASPDPALALGATFTVNATDDTTDDPSCDATHCSPREAIVDANAAGGTDTIEFDIAGPGPHTIQPTSTLPTITDPVVIDGTSEPDFAGAPIVELDGTSAGASASGLTISAGSSTIMGLVINRFAQEGISLHTNGGNVIAGNYIGTDVTGLEPFGNGSNGVLVTDVPNNTIGGTSPGSRNVISGNAVNGVSVGGFGEAATGNLVQGNFIGTDVTGTADLGNGLGGVLISLGSGNVIGGAVPEARNIISGNGQDETSADGVVIQPGSSNLVQGNFVGTDVTGSADLGNTGDGVAVLGQSNKVGGTADGEGNVIAFNGGRGVFVGAGNSNPVLSNSIFSNGGLGVDLEGDDVTPNDLGDVDVGANALQNFPELTSAFKDAVSVEVTGTLDSSASTQFRLEFFSSVACDAPTGHGEGETFLGSTDVTTDGAGDASFAVTLPVALPAGHSITATATDQQDNTSEFSACALVAVPPPVPGASPAGLAVTSGLLLAAFIWALRRRRLALT